jgi:hypothetical protein
MVSLEFKVVQDEENISLEVFSGGCLVAKSTLPANGDGHNGVPPEVLFASVFEEECRICGVQYVV